MTERSAGIIIHSTTAGRSMRGQLRNPTTETIAAAAAVFRNHEKDCRNYAAEIRT